MLLFLTLAAVMILANVWPSWFRAETGVDVSPYLDALPFGECVAGCIGLVALQCSSGIATGLPRTTSGARSATRTRPRSRRRASCYFPPHRRDGATAAGSN